VAYYLVLFAAGFAGSFHCLGMCGGFACALGSDPRGRGTTVLRHLVYNSGRLTTYCFLGGLAGALGEAICGTQGLSVPMSDSLAPAQAALAIVAGLLMICMALQFFGLFGFAHRLSMGFGGSTLVMSLRSLLPAHGLAAPLALGVLNGFLPCPLVYAFVAEAASTGGALHGILSMAAFGLGTFPAMLMMGGIGQVLTPVWRRRGVRLAGVFILLLGLITIGRGILPMNSHSMATGSMAHRWSGAPSA
jgi:uncharacterized protein